LSRLLLFIAATSSQPPLTLCGCRALTAAPHPLIRTPSSSQPAPLHRFMAATPPQPRHTFTAFSSRLNHLHSAL
jgi:hypothetical protein